MAIRIKHPFPNLSIDDVKKLTPRPSMLKDREGVWTIFYLFLGALAGS